VAEGAGLENQCTARYPGFKSLTLRQKKGWEFVTKTVRGAIKPLRMLQATASTIDLSLKIWEDRETNHYIHESFLKTDSKKLSG
jgi:hypothetical protein